MTKKSAMLHQMNNNARLPVRRDEGETEQMATIARMCAIINEGRPMNIGSSIISPPSQVPPSTCRNGNTSPISTKMLAQPIEQPPVELLLAS
jgi:hypothetical protein